MNVNQKCYYFEDITLKETGFFDNIIDCCYVLTMENSKRSKNINYRLSIMGYPCKKIRIQYNKGFRNCEKVLKEQKTNYDIIDANNNVFLDAKKNKFKNIMVLEDDFIFTDRVKNPEIIKDVENLFDSMDVNIFNLGPILFIYNPLYLIYRKHNCIKCQFAPIAHGMIYSPKFYNKFTEEYRLNKITNPHFDYNFNNFFIDGIYCHSNLLCIQSFSETENSKNWGPHLFNKVTRFFIKILDLDSDYPLQGFKKANLIGYIFNFITYIVLIYLIIRIITI